MSVYKKRQPNKYAYVAEVRSMLELENQNRPPSGMFVRMLSCASAKGVALDYIDKRGSTVVVTREKRIKYAKEILRKEM